MGVGMIHLQVTGGCSLYAPLGDRWLKHKQKNQNENKEYEKLIPKTSKDMIPPFKKFNPPGTHSDTHRGTQFPTIIGAHRRKHTQTLTGAHIGTQT